MKKLLCVLMCMVMLSMQTSAAFAIQDAAAAARAAKAPVYNQNARTISYAFVFDGPSDKNASFLEQFQKSITASTAPEYKATFPKNLVFTGDWTKKGAEAASKKALNSNATMVVSLGYLSSKYFNEMKSKNKFVVTIDQYGLKDLGEGFFNPVRQSTKGIMLFKKLVGFHKAAILMTESYYKTRNDWEAYGKEKLPGVDFTIIPVHNDAAAILQAIPADADAVIFTPLFNLSAEKKQTVINELNSRKISTYSTVGKEDVEMGVLMGTGALDVDRKVAEATSFSIKGVLNGERKFDSKVSFYEDQLLYVNKDTAEEIGHAIHLRVLDTAEIISNQKADVYSLGTIFTKFEEQNLDIKRADKLVAAARRSSWSAILKWLPSFNITLGFQEYNEAYADSAKLTTPKETGIFKMGFEQIIFAPELITNILIKHKQVNFKKSERILAEQNAGINLATLYVNTLMMDNLIKVQKENVKESRENLAIARVREKMGKCGKEEALRWAAQLSVAEQQLIEMNAALKNLKIDINKVLAQDPTTKFDLAELTAHDPAFYTSEINLINYVTNPAAIEQFTKMLVEEVYAISPELAKLRAAIKMKKYEMAMYYQKFVLPSAKLSFEYTSLINPEYTGNVEMLQPTSLGTHPLTGSSVPTGIQGAFPGADHGFYALPHANKTNGKFGIFAQWTPIEGGTKIAEIARVKAEMDELKLYEEEVHHELERHIRDVINRAIASYITIEKKYKAMFAAKENYLLVKREYLQADDMTIAQLTDAQKVYLDAKAAVLNSQYEFFKELLWVQRGLCSVNWLKANDRAKNFIQRIKDELPEKSDIQLL